MRKDDFQGFEEDDEPPPERPGFGGQGKRDGNSDRQAGGSAKTGHSTRFATVWADDIEIKLDQPGLVDGLLASTAMTVVYGESGAGKTFVVIDLGCHVAAGKPWRGMTVEQGVVVYIAGESPESVQRRIWAWKQRHGVEHLPVLVVTSNVDLLNGDADELVTLVGQIRETRGRVALTIVDTLARAMVGNENAPDDMGKFVSACGRIREASGGHVLIVHHCGKDLARGARGHSSLRAATDVELEITNGEAGGCIRVSKHRDEAGGTSYGFKLETVELGTNAKGRMVTTCVVAESEAEVTPVTRVTALPPNMRVTYEALQAAISDHGAEPPPARDIPRTAKVVTVEQWREAAVRYLPQAENKQKNQAFKRSMEALVAQKIVRHVNGVVWLPAAKAVMASGHAGHTGHMKPNVTDVTSTQAPGHTGHAGHTHSIECDPRDRDREGQEQPIEGSEDGLEERAEGGDFDVETFLASMSAEEREWLNELGTISEKAIGAAVNRANAERREVTRDDIREVARLQALEDARPVLVENTRGVEATVARIAASGQVVVEEVRLLRLQAGPYVGGDLIDLACRQRHDPENPKAGWCRHDNRWRFEPYQSVLVVEGHGLGLGQYGLHASSEALERLRASGSKVLVDTFRGAQP